MATVLCSEGCRSRLCFETFFRWVLFGGNGEGESRDNRGIHEYGACFPSLVKANTALKYRGLMG